MILVRDPDLKKDKDYFGFSARAEIGATKELIKVDEIFDKIVSAPHFWAWIFNFTSKKIGSGGLSRWF